MSRLPVPMRPGEPGRLRRATLLIACGVIAFGKLSAHAFAPREPSAPPEDPFSPLFARRLDIGLQNMDQPPGRSGMVAWHLFNVDPVATPASANPLSVCIASGCALSVCLGSGCIGSTCLGSACHASGCFGSACILSGCGGSVCVGSACFGSVCVGSGCFGSVCLSCAAERDPGQIETLEAQIGGTAL